MTFSDLPQVTIRTGETAQKPTRPPSRQAAFWDKEEGRLYISTKEMSWVQINAEGSSDGGQSLNYVEFTYSTPSPLDVGLANAGDFVERVQIVISTAFDGSSPQLTVGFTGNTSLLFPSNMIDMDTTGTYVYYPSYKFIGTQTIRLYLTLSGASQGSATLWLSYRAAS
jgi:hypothetical protein